MPREGATPRPIRFEVLSGDCWRCTSHKATINNAFIIISRQGKKYYLHRYMWEKHTGKTVPVGKVLFHICGNKWCINPDHIKLESRSVASARIARRRLPPHIFASPKLMVKQVLEIRENRDRLSQNQLAEHYGVSQPDISFIQRNINWKDIEGICPLCGQTIFTKQEKKA